MIKTGDKIQDPLKAGLHSHLLKLLWALYTLIPVLIRIALGKGPRTEGYLQQSMSLPAYIPPPLKKKKKKKYLCLALSDVNFDSHHTSSF